MNKKANTTLLVLWLITGGVDIASALAGNQPSWYLVFCPLFCLILELISNYYD